MPLISKISDLCSFGASETGPFHKSLGMPNEDAWLRTTGSFGSLIVLSDGVGSCRNARFGATAVCKAVYNAARTWNRSPELKPYDFLSIIEILWEKIISPMDPAECKATCLLALCRPDGELLVGGIGDGVAVVKGVSSTLEWVIGPRSNDFSNTTPAMGNNADASKWVLRSFRGYTDAVVMLATDGVSDDLIFEKISDFITWIISEFAEMPPLLRWHAIRKELRNWPTPRHTDDKTLALLLVRLNEALNE